jgi:hypothetical protein
MVRADLAVVRWLPPSRGRTRCRPRRSTAGAGGALASGAVQRQQTDPVQFTRYDAAMPVIEIGVDRLRTFPLSPPSTKSLRNKGNSCPMAPFLSQCSVTAESAGQSGRHDPGRGEGVRGGPSGRLQLQGRASISGQPCSGKSLIAHNLRPRSGIHPSLWSRCRWTWEE